MASVVRDLAAAGAAAVIVTEISRDGLMLGPDLPGYRALLRTCDVPLIASGGTGSLDDLRRLAPVAGEWPAPCRSDRWPGHLRGALQRPRRRGGRARSPRMRLEMRQL